MGPFQPQHPASGSVLAAPGVPRPRAAGERLPHREPHGAAPPAWPAADRFADRSGLGTTQARLLLAAFCGLPPDHAYGDPPGC